MSGHCSLGVLARVRLRCDIRHSSTPTSLLCKKYRAVVVVSPRFEKLSKTNEELDMFSIYP